MRKRGTAPTLPTEPAEREATAAQKREARTKLVKSVRACYTAGAKDGPMYGEAVRAVMEYEDAGATRREIAQAISEAWQGGRKGRNVSKGNAARYIVLARRARGGAAVTVEGTKFESVLKALDSGKVSFTSVYNAVTERKARRRVQYARSAFDAASATIAKLRVTYRAGGKLVRASATKDIHAFAGCLQALIGSPIAAEVTTPVVRRRLWETLMGLPGLVAVERRSIKVAREVPVAPASGEQSQRAA